VKHRLDELAKSVAGRLVGDPECLIDGVGTLQRASEGQIAFLASGLYRQYLAQTAASAVILTESDLADYDGNAIVVKDPYLAYARIAGLVADEPPRRFGVHPSAVVEGGCHVADSTSIGANSFIGSGASIGENVYIGPGCVIESGAVIGADSTLVAQVTIGRDVTVGARALIHPGVVLGADGFGLANDEGVWVKVPQLGSVRIGDDVEIGANTTIDRGAIEDTIIEEGVKLDNLIQIGHNAHVGAHTAIAAAAMLAGSCTIGKHCTIAGGVGIGGHISVADGTTITAMSMVTSPIRESGVYSSGIPLDTNRNWHRNAVRFKKLDEISRRLKELEKRFDKVKNKG